VPAVFHVPGADGNENAARHNCLVIAKFSMS
jgi:hypothetical protein